MAVWRIDESLSDLQAAAKNLPYDMKVIGGFKSEERKKQWLAVRLLCQLLSPNDTISYKSTGQPQVESGKISISHSHDLVAISLNRNADTGIDIQYLDSKILRIQNKFLSDSESQWAKDDLQSVTIVWSIKEAMYKLYGDASPYFKQDYELIKTDNNYSCSMKYEGKKIDRLVNLHLMDNFVIALIND